MQAQLQDGVDLAPCAGLDLRQPVDIPRIEHQRLFADGVAVRAQGEAHMGVMQIVGRADADIVDALAEAAQLVDIAVETLELGEEMSVGKVAVHHPDRVVGVQRRLQRAADRQDRLHMARRDIAGRADQCKLAHGLNKPRAFKKTTPSLFPRYRHSGDR